VGCNAIKQLNLFMIEFKTISKAVTVTALLICTCCFTAWHSEYSNNRVKLKAIQSIAIYPVNLYKENETIKINSITDTVSRICSGNFILYKLPSVTEFVTGKQIKGTDPYFIYNKNCDFGYYFSKIKDTGSGKKWIVDSFLIKYARDKQVFDTPTDSIWPLQKTIKNQQKDSLIFDSIYYYYTKNLNKLDYTLSKGLDSSKGMKLYKVRLIYASKFSSTYKTTLPVREFRFELREVSVENTEEVLQFIEHFKIRHKEYPVS